MANDIYGENGGRRIERWVIMVNTDHPPKFVPLVDVHGDAVAYPTRKAAAPDLYQAKRIYGKRDVYLQKYGPWSLTDKILTRHRRGIVPMSEEERGRKAGA